MWGENFLVAPKLGTPQKFGLAMNGVYNITVYLPPEADWYVQQTKEFVAGSSSMQWIVVGDFEMATFVKAGSIVPFLQVKESAMSLMQTIDSNIRLEVFPDVSKVATGNLYLDDYQTHEYRNGAYSSVHYDYDGTILEVTKMCSQCGFYKASNKMINEIQFMNVEQIPYAVVNRWLNNTPYPDQGTVYVDFVYLPDTKLLKVGPVSIPMDDGLVFNQP